MSLNGTRESVAYIVTNRIVYTYQLDGWPAGVLTAYEDGEGVVLEHVIAFPGVPRGTLAAMLEAGLEEAWARGYQYVTFMLPHAFPLTPVLRRLGERLGFTPYAGSESVTWYVRWRP